MVHIKIDDECIDDDDIMAIIQPVWYSVNIYEGYEKYQEDLKSITVEQKHIFACFLYEAEVNNGGHFQFFCNSAGMVWKDAIEGYNAIGLKEYADIIEESISRIGVNPSFVRQERIDQLDDDADFDDIDDKFYQLQDKIDSHSAMLDYIKAHREKFYFEGDIEDEEDNENPS